MSNIKPVFLPNNNLFFYNNKYRGLIYKYKVVLFCPKKPFYENVYFPCIYENRPVLTKVENAELGQIAMCRISGNYFILNTKGWRGI